MRSICGMTAIGLLLHRRFCGLSRKESGRTLPGSCRVRRKLRATRRLFRTADMTARKALPVVRIDRIGLLCVSRSLGTIGKQLPLTEPACICRRIGHLGRRERLAPLRTFIALPTMQPIARLNARKRVLQRQAASELHHRLLLEAGERQHNSHGATNRSIDYLLDAVEEFG